MCSWLPSLKYQTSWQWCAVYAKTLVRDPVIFTPFQHMHAHTQSIGEARPTDFEHCVLWARLLFEQLFVNEVLQLLYLHPASSTNESGAPYWSAPKRSVTSC